VRQWALIKNAPWNPVDQFSIGFLLRWNLLLRFLRKLYPLEQPSQNDLNALSISERLAAFCASQAGDKRELCQSSLELNVSNLGSF
jgi:hypothetical protein